MGYISNRIHPSELAVGDHIYSYRKTWGYLFPHHGIFVGGDKVVHFMGDTSVMAVVSGAEISPYCERCKFDGRMTGVVSSCVKCFLKGGTLRRFGYGVGVWERIIAMRGVCSMTKADAEEEVVERASFFERKKTFGEYDVIENNCMHFAYYCKTGQIRDGERRALSVWEVEGSIAKMVREKSVAWLLVSGCNAVASCFTDQQQLLKVEHLSSAAAADNNDTSSWAVFSLLRLLQSTSRPLLLSPTHLHQD